MNIFKKLRKKDTSDIEQFLNIESSSYLDHIWELNLEEWEDEILEKALVENNLDDSLKNECYMHYDSSNKGCNMENPFVLSELENYVRLEYLMMKYLYEADPFRPVCRKLHMQSYVNDGGRMYDCLRWQVIDLQGCETWSPCRN